MILREKIQRPGVVAASGNDTRHAIHFVGKDLRGYIRGAPRTSAAISANVQRRASSLANTELARYISRRVFKQVEGVPCIVTLEATDLPRRGSSPDSYQDWTALSLDTFGFYYSHSISAMSSATLTALTLESGSRLHR